MLIQSCGPCTVIAHPLIEETAHQYSCSSIPTTLCFTFSAATVSLDTQTVHTVPADRLTDHHIKNVFQGFSLVAGSVPMCGYCFSCYATIGDQESQP